jgi:transposase-like protein
MGRSIPYDIRVKVVERRKSGQNYAEIATEFGLSVSGVKKLWYTYLKEGSSAFETKYKNCGRRSPFGHEIRDAVAKIRDNSQGAEYIRSKLEMELNGKRLPCARTIQRWWAAEGSNRLPGRVREQEKRDGLSKSTESGK